MSLQRCSRRWVVPGGAALALLAGYVNVVMLGFFHVPVSHMTGAVSRLGMDVAERHWLDMGIIVAIFVGFLGGAVLCGTIIGGTRLRPGRRYGVALLIEAGLLGLAAVTLSAQWALGGMFLAAMACGVQNAMASSYYGLVVRTTHVTGIVTDLGVMIGHWLRHRRVEAWKVGLLTSLLLAFGVGGMVGAWMAGRAAELALWPAAGCCAIGGLSYITWHRRSRAARRRRRRRLPAATDAGRLVAE